VPLEITEALLTVAQIAVGLAGFSAVLVALSGDPHRWTALDSFRIKGMLSLSFGALFLSLVPFVLAFLSFAEATRWRASLGLLSLFSVVGVVITFGQFRRLSTPERAALHPPLVYANEVSLSLLALLEVAAALGLIGCAPGIFFLGVVALLALSAFTIVRFLFARPAA
jgi:hypothetical protein